MAEQENAPLAPRQLTLAAPAYAGASAAGITCTATATTLPTRSAVGPRCTKGILTDIGISLGRTGGVRPRGAKQGPTDCPELTQAG
jgi:hypothetical protein